MVHWRFSDDLSSLVQDRVCCSGSDEPVGACAASSNGDLPIAIIVGVAVAVPLLLLVIFALFMYKRRQLRNERAEEGNDQSIPEAAYAVAIPVPSAPEEDYPEKQHP